MANQLKLMVGTSALAALLAACGGGGSSSSPAADASDATARALPPEIAAIIDQENALTDALCPLTSAAPDELGNISPEACLDEGEEGAEDDSGYELSLNPVVQQFCPEAAQAFDGTLTFNGEMLEQDFIYDTDTSFDGSATFPAACLEEAAGSMDQFGDLIGGANPITDAICPMDAADGEVDPANCFAEAIAAGSLPGGDEGGDGGDPIAEQLCPETGSAAPDAEAPTACLDEASRVYVTIVDMITATNPLTEQLCPIESASGRYDPDDCFAEAIMGAGGFPGDGGGDGGDGGSGDGGDASNPFAPLMEQFCPETATAPLSESTAIDCLSEAGGNFQDVQDLLTGPNPLTENLCPEAAQSSPIDPAACFMEAAGGGLPGGGGGGNPLAPVLEQFCPDTAAGDLGPTTPIDCLTEAGSAFGDVEELIGGANPLTEALCPEAAQTSPIDPAACFMEATEAGLPGGGDTENPLTPVLEQFCPQAAMDGLSETTAIDCLTEAGGNFQDVQDLLLGPNPLTENLCPNAAQTTPIDPAACFEEAAAGDGGGGDNPLAPVLEQFCPETAGAAVGPTTPIDCLTEAGDAFGDVQDLISGANPLTEQFCPAESADGTVDPAVCFEEALAGGTPGGGDNPLQPVLDQFCPETGAGEIGPTTPIDCLAETGGNFQDVQDLLLGPNPLTENLCPVAAQSSPIDPAACFEEAAGGAGGGGENPLAPVLDQFCPETAAGEVGPTTPIDCLTEAGAAFGDVEELISGSNPLTEQFCPEESADGNVDPAACFEEALSGGTPGGGDNPLAPVLEQFCPATAEAEVGPTTPIDCLSEAGSNFGNIEDALGGSNPLTDALCPIESTDGSVDPAACFEEAVAGGGMGGENPFGGALEQFCPVTAGGEIGPSTPSDCLMEAGANLGALEELLGPLSEPNPLTEQVCPETSATGSVEPTACFIESLDNIEFLDIPLSEECSLLNGTNEEGDVSLTLGLGCLLEEASGADGEDNPLTGLFDTLLGGLL